MKAPNGYTSRPSGDDPRSTEAWALGEASRRLALAAKMNDGGEALREALRLNQRLWSIFQAALSEPDCPLPKDVRDNVLTLSLMIDRHVMARLGPRRIEDPADPRYQSRHRRRPGGKICPAGSGCGAPAASRHQAATGGAPVMRVSA